MSSFKSKDNILVKDAIIEEIKTHKILVEDKSKQLEKLDEKVKEKENEVSNLTSEKVETENKNNKLEERLEQLENEKRLEAKYYSDKEKWKEDKDNYVLKEWDKLPKQKWYLFLFILVLAIIVVVMFFVYNQFKTADLLKFLLPICSLIGGTIILSFFNREKITTSFKYNFKTEKFRKSKVKEFEDTYSKNKPEPKRNDYTKYK